MTDEGFAQSCVNPNVGAIANTPSASFPSPKVYTNTALPTLNGAVAYPVCPGQPMLSDRSLARVVTTKLPHSL